MKILLASLHAGEPERSIALGNASIAAYLDARLGIAPVLIDFSPDQSSEEIASRLSALNADAIGFSVFVWNREKLCAAARLIASEYSRASEAKASPPAAGETPGKDTAPKGPKASSPLIFAGGPEASADPGGVLREGMFDFLIVGEGEKTMAEAALALEKENRLESLEGLPGVLTRTSPRVHAACREAVELSELPSPYLSGLIPLKTGKSVLWELSRGCPFACSYCFESKGSRSVRRYPEERIRSELALFAERNCDQVYVLDPTFNSEPARAKRILRLIAEKSRGQYFFFEARAEFLDMETARLLASLPSSTQIGLQSSNPEVLRKSGRSFDKALFERKIGLLNESGALFGFDLIYGLPGDSLASFRKSIDFALSLYPNHIDAFPLSVLPGTRLAEEAKAEGLVAEDRPPYRLLDHPGFPGGELETAAALAKALEFFYTRGKAVPWFNQVLWPLEAKPGAFLSSFAEWMRKKGRKVSFDEIEDHEIPRIQIAFLGEEYGKKGLQRFMPLVESLVLVNHALANALVAPPYDESGFRDFARNPSATVLELAYDIDAILGAGAFDIEEFCRDNGKKPCRAVIYRKKGEIRAEKLRAGKGERNAAANT